MLAARSITVPDGFTVTCYCSRSVWSPHITGYPRGVGESYVDGTIDTYDITSNTTT
jgi:hypothetical protein